MNHYNYTPNRGTTDSKPVPASAFPFSSSPNIWYCSKCGQFFRNPGRTKNLSCGACGFSLDETSMSEKDYDAKTTEEKEQWKKEYVASHLPKASVNGLNDDYEVSYHPNRLADIISFTCGDGLHPDVLGEKMSGPDLKKVNKQGRSCESMEQE